MKRFDLSFVVIVASVLLGCRTSSAPDPTDMPVWNQIQVGMTRQQVYELAGKPLRETESEAYWESPPAKEGWPSSQVFVRKLKVFFDANGRVTNEWSGRTQK
jgi:outer membrane protein assembly factor BamE (lipoprotein component of BamABCDE complex)